MNNRRPTEPILRVQHLCKYFPVYSRGVVRRKTGEIRALDDVSLELFTGETLGLVGESGCGKTTACRTILRALQPTRGQVLFKANGETVDLAVLKGRQLKALRPKMQMIFQDPFSSLNPRMTVGSIVGEPLRIHRMAGGSELADRVTAALVSAGLKPDDATRYPHAFSGGQRQRIGIARALVMRPSLVIADEAVSALDVSVQAQIINLLEDLRDEFHLTYIFVAHDLSVVRHISDRVAVMYAGRIVELAHTEAIFREPKHPYTRGLIASVPSCDPDVKIASALIGEPADPARLPGGCSFHPRCSLRLDQCPKQVPSLRASGKDHSVACHLWH